MASIASSSTEKLLRIYGQHGLIKKGVAGTRKKKQEKSSKPATLAITKSRERNRETKGKESMFTAIRKAHKPITQKITLSPAPVTPRSRRAVASRSSPRRPITNGGGAGQAKSAHQGEVGASKKPAHVSPTRGKKEKAKLSPRRSKLQAKQRSRAWELPVRVAIFNPWASEEKCERHPGGRNILYCLVEKVPGLEKGPAKGGTETAGADAGGTPTSTGSDAVATKREGPAARTAPPLSPPGLPPPGLGFTATGGKVTTEGTRADWNQPEKKTKGATGDSAQSEGLQRRAPVQKQVEKRTHTSKRFVVEFVDTAKIRRGELRTFDVVVFPGGSSALQAQVLGKSGRDAVRAFIAAGGGFVGFCAGAFLALSHYRPERSLKMVSASVVLKREQLPAPNLAMYARQGKGEAKASPSAASKTKKLTIIECRPSKQRQEEGRAAVAEESISERARATTPKREAKATVARTRPRVWEFGHGHVDVRFTKVGRQLLWDEGKPWEEEEDEREAGVIEVRYNNGPLMKAQDPPEIGSFCRQLTPLATFNSGVKLPTGTTVHKGAMQDRIAIGYAKPRLSFRPRPRCGCVVLCAPHPESTTAGSLAKAVSKDRYKRLVQRLVQLASGISSQ